MICRQEGLFLALLMPWSPAVLPAPTCHPAQPLTPAPLHVPHVPEDQHSESHGAHGEAGKERAKGWLTDVMQQSNRNGAAHVLPCSQPSVLATSLPHAHSRNTLCRR